MKTRPRLTVVSLATLAFIIACGGDPSGPPAVAIIEISGLPEAMVVGQTTQLTAAAFEANYTALRGRTATWSTSDAAIVTVGAASGLVTAVAPGSATITATIEGAKQSQSVIVVPTPVAVVEATLGSDTLQINETTQATAVTFDRDRNVLTGRTVTWRSDSPAIASVSETGLVTAIRPGTTVIIASSEGRNTTDLRLTVTRGNPAEAPQITAVTPGTLVEGQVATITGSRFGATPGENVVRVGDLVATVTAASATSLQIMVPSVCLPAADGH